MTELVIRVFGTPAPQGSKKGFVHNGRVSMVESSKKVKPWRESVKFAALDAMTSCDWEMVTGPVELHATFTFPRPRSHYRTGKNALFLRDAAPAFPGSRPDLDKILRSTCDALGEAGVWRDDAQVVRVVTTKVYGQRAGAHIAVSEATA